MINVDFLEALASEAGSPTGKAAVIIAGGNLSLRTADGFFFFSILKAFLSCAGHSLNSLRKWYGQHMA